MKTRLVHNIAPVRHNENYSTPEAVLKAAETDLITFDGVFQNVYFYRDLIPKFTYPPILFPMGNYVGGDNTFDKPMPFERFCDWNQLMELVTKFGCRLGWHTWSHRNLPSLKDADARAEITPPFKMDYFAYPYGSVGERERKMVIEADFKMAFSVFKGDPSDIWTIHRSYV